jgi:hypothetical protein
MWSAPWLVVVLLLAVNPALSMNQKPKKTTRTASHAGKGTPAYLPHHSGGSSTVPPGAGRNSAAVELSRVEHQSMHAGPSAKQARVKAAGTPKPVTGKGDRNAAINFTSHSAGRSFAVTNSKSGAKAPKGLGTKPRS